MDFLYLVKYCEISDDLCNMFRTLAEHTTRAKPQTCVSKFSSLITTSLPKKTLSFHISTNKKQHSMSEFIVASSVLTQKRTVPPNSNMEKDNSQSKMTNAFDFTFKWNKQSFFGFGKTKQTNQESKFPSKNDSNQNLVQ